MAAVLVCRTTTITRVRRRNPPPPLPSGAIQAVCKIERVEDPVYEYAVRWWACYQDANGVDRRVSISKVDAWNFDIEHNLKIVMVLAEDGSCRIVRKVNKSNKRYIQVDASVFD